VKALKEIPLPPLDIERFRDVLPAGDYRAVEGAAQHAREVFDGRVIWHVNSTGRGGGVAEMLRTLPAYARGLGVDVRWVVLRGNPEFFTVTKRLHNRLHGVPGDGGPLGAREREIYDRTLGEAGVELAGAVRGRDVVFLHDPQTAGLASPVRAAGPVVLWRCHVGLDIPNELAREAWEFLRSYVEDADAYVFSRRAYSWEGLDLNKVWIVPPSIDAFSPKNQDLDAAKVQSILQRIGLGDEGPPGETSFLRTDGTPGRVDRAAEIVQASRLSEAAPVVSQVSRWDRLKDPVGVIDAFERHPGESVDLVLAGPATAAVADDPEGAAVFEEVRSRREALAADLRHRVHLVSLPMDDLEENAAMVNALQRRADVIVQKSLAEGFGLTVAESMWKSRPVVASRVGGIQEQIVDGESGILVDDPLDADAFGEAVSGLLADPARGRAIGAAARERVREQFLANRHLLQYLNLIASLEPRS
jgi:trehalose synthase